MDGRLFRIFEILELFRQKTNIFTRRFNTAGKLGFVTITVKNKI